MNRLSLCFIILLFLGLNSCKKESNDPKICAQNWAIELQPLITAISDAAITYGNNPTPATCNAYKEACQDYIDALEPFLDCAAWTPQQKAELQAAIDQSEDNIDSFCND